MSFTPSPNSAPASPASPKTWAVVVWGLYVAGIVTGGFGGLVGLIIAYLKRADVAGTPFESHFTSAIRTFWISLIGALVGFLLSVVGIGIIVLVAVGVWNVFRSVRGLIRALDGRPIEDPTGWL